MLVGYNTNIKYKGTVYHVQTEDSGIKNPFIVTLLYHKGTILSSKKISYAQYAASPDYKKQVRELMKEQHKSMIKELVSGKFAADSTSETKPDTTPLPEPEITQEAEEEKSQIEKSLDDVLLDYIMKRDES
jgi:ketol-acid reductoisomerase